MRISIALLLIAAMLLCGVASALPTTGSSTLVGSNNVTLGATGAATPCWFVWGQQPGTNQTWKTPNQTASGGVCTYTVKGSPLIGNTLFYWRACDATGCGATKSFTAAPVTPVPTTTYGATFDNLTENGMDITLVGLQSVAPYTWLVPDFAALIWGLVFAFIFIGLWLRGRDMLAPTLVGLIIGGFIFFGGQGLNLGIPAEFVDLAQGLTYASIAGIILVIIKK